VKSILLVLPVSSSIQILPFGVSAATNTSSEKPLTLRLKRAVSGFISQKIRETGRSAEAL
jgi:hypothetical protein